MKPPTQLQPIMGPCDASILQPTRPGDVTPRRDGQVHRHHYSLGQG
jgi:hypothetical protein